jgi:hypothetical protein
MIVVEEIEGWYLAGLSQDDSRAMNIRHLGMTDQITKEVFVTLKPRQFVSTVDFMSEIVKYFSVDLAVTNNGSFAYFVRKFLS